MCIQHCLHSRSQERYILLSVREIIGSSMCLRAYMSMCIFAYMHTCLRISVSPAHHWLSCISEDFVHFFTIYSCGYNFCCAVCFLCFQVHKTSTYYELVCLQCPIFQFSYSSDVATSSRTAARKEWEYRIDIVYIANYSRFTFFIYHFHEFGCASLTYWRSKDTWKTTILWRTLKSMTTSFKTHIQEVLRSMTGLKKAQATMWCMPSIL